MSIIIKNVLLDNKEKDIYIEDNRIREISESINTEAEHRIDGKDKAIVPGLVNGHSHAAMTLFRGYADDMELEEWLNKKIWPLETKLSEEDVYWGTRLACLEMMKSGTTFFNDMYWHFHGAARAVSDSGLRAAISAVFIDFFEEEKAKQQVKHNLELYKEAGKYGNRLIFALGPHAMYTVSPESLQWAKEFADKNNLLIHFHLSETKREVDDCIKQHKKRPVEYLNDIGFLGPNLVACHAVWVDEHEISLLKQHDVKIVHNPVSNMKLSVGLGFPYQAFRKAGLTMALGTDGCASNNNLDLFEEMKIVALLEKFTSDNPTAMPAKEAFDLVTRSGARALNLDAGEIAPGKLADVLLIDLKNINMVPNHNLLSNLVYSANGTCVDTTICDGKILMQNRNVPGEEELVSKVHEVAQNFVTR